MEYQDRQDMQDQEINLHRAIGRVEGKLDGLIASLNDHISKDEKAWNRISELEKKLVYAAGVVSVVVFAITSGFLGILKKLGITS